MSHFQDVTFRYSKQLPTLPPGWTWYLWEDVVDGHEKVLIRLRDDKLHCKANGTIDVGMYGNGSAVIERAKHMHKFLLKTGVIH